MNTLRKVAFVASMTALATIFVAKAEATPVLPSTDVSLASFWNSISANWWDFAQPAPIQGGTTLPGNTTSNVIPGLGTVVGTVSTVLNWTLSISYQIENGFKVYTALGGEWAKSKTETSVNDGPSTTSFSAPFVDKFIAETYSVAVPGPIAAAGLPFLVASLGGFAWMRRRQMAA